MPVLMAKTRVKLRKHYDHATVERLGFQTYTVMAGEMSYGTVSFSFETHLWSAILRHRTGTRAFEHEDRMVVLNKLLKSRCGRLATVTREEIK